MTRHRALGRLVVLGLLFVTLAGPVLASPLSSALGSQIMDIIRTVTSNPDWRDLFEVLICFLIFLGAIVRPLQDRLGKPGKAVAVAFAIMLSVALEMTGRFHLLDLGPVAGIGLFGLLGCVVGLGFRSLYEAGWGSTVAVSYVVGYGAMRVAAPTLLPTLGEFVFVPELLYVLCILYLLYALATKMFSGTSVSTAWVRPALRALRSRPPAARQRLNQSAVAQEQLAQLTEEKVAEDGAVLAELAETAHAVKSYTSEHPELKAVISSRLQELSQVQRAVQEKLVTCLALAQHIVDFDVADLAELKKEFDQLPEDVQKEAKQALSGIRQKLATDRRLLRMEQAVQANSAAVADALLRAKTELTAGRIKSCLKALEESAKAAQEADRLTAQLEKFANRLKRAAAEVLAQAGTRAAETVQAP